MRCNICCRPDVKAINLELLQRAGRRTGVFTAMAKRLGVHRATLWRHRKEHLKIFTSMHAPKTEGLSLEERAAMLGREADRLQAQCENGAPRDVMDQALKSLGLRMKALELEAKFSGKGIRPKEEVAGALEDPEEEARVRKDFEEVCGGEQ